ncbi:hypothetical protein H0H92_011692 [Tricholoma furcatifolium]|nr:hypothetical protein H0H92_011692 [Tricholoma furcatifolium]
MFPRDPRFVSFLPPLCTKILKIVFSYNRVGLSFASLPMIPKPRKFLKRYSGCTTFKELRSHCKWTNEKFNKVKETVRCVKKRHLNYGEGGNIILEDHVKRKNIENEVLPLLPELDGFQDVWMLYAILERIAAIERDIVMPSKLKLRHKHTRCGNKKKTKFLTSVNKCTKTSDKPDTKISKALEAPLSEPNSSASELTSSTNQARVSMPPVTSEPNLEQTPVIALDDGLGVIECPRLVARQPKFRPAPRHDKTDEPGPIRIGYAACLFCQYVPDIPSSAQTILQRDFGSQKGIIAALVGLGITNDRHLFILNKLRMWNLGLEPFLNSLLSKNEISLLQKLSLLASFKRQSELNTESDLVLMED